jgi:hypothetical protein
MRFRVMVCAALGAALLFSGGARAGRVQNVHAHSVGLVVHDGVALRGRPDVHASVMATLIRESQVIVLARQGSWLHVSIWAGVEGWLPASEIVYRRPWPSVSTYHAPQTRSQVRPFGPERLHQPALATGTVSLAVSPGSPTIGHLSAGTRLNITAWAQDGRGAEWYRVGKYWAQGDPIRFVWGAGVGAGTRPVQGKGMWLTLDPITSASPAAILDAAQRAGITHLYLETAISPLGFHGRQSVGPLVDAGHRRHIAVIAWVYPYLEDIAADVALTRRVAAFRTPAGWGFDGIAADLENNVRLQTIRAYSQLVRGFVGTRYLLVGVTYPPQMMSAYPYVEIAHDYDVIAPMDYWHETKSAGGPDYPQLRYGRDYAFRYASDSISRIRRSVPGAVVAPIGQAFDNFGRMELGPYAPSAQEIEGFLAGSKAGGAIGVSFFQWMTATVGEWGAIRVFQY